MNEDYKVSQSSFFELDSDIVSLPSQGLLYKNGVKELEVEYLTGMDEGTLTSPNRMERGDAVDIILRRRIRNKSIDPDELLLGDKLAILFWMRATAYGPEYDIRVVDPATGQLFDHSVNLATLKIKKLEVKPDKNGEFEILLPRSGKRLKFRLMTGRDEKGILSRLEAFKRADDEGSLKVQFQLETMIMEVDGDRDKMNISKFIRGIPLMDYRYLKTYITKIEPGLDLTIDVQTPSGMIVKTVVPIEESFFFPPIRL
jgi:hypothetical protein